VIDGLTARVGGGENGCLIPVDNPQFAVWAVLPEPTRVAVVRLLGALASRAAVTGLGDDRDGDGAVSAVGPDGWQDPLGAPGSAGCECVL
jgi:hypothetical protein